MQVFIARDGVEIGEFNRTELEGLARTGQLQPSDYYWHEGMEAWRHLDDLLSANLWSAQRFAEPEVPSETLPRLAPRGPAPDFFRRFQPEALKKFRVPALALALVAFALVVAILIRAYGGGRTAALFPRQKSALTADEMKKAAIADLDARLKSLPTRPKPPLYTFYYDLQVKMGRSGQERAPWEAVIRGNEDVVDPATQETISHTQLVLTVEYAAGAWRFRKYHASISDTKTRETTEINFPGDAPMPPAILGLLGLKIP